MNPTPPKKQRRVNRGENAAPQKPVRTAPTNTSLLPPCRVCQEPGAGFHYGVNTCEACKGFFRRSLIRKKDYACFGSGDCNIHAGKRKICPKCRLEKCLAVGMSKEAIKTGRYTHAKRTQDILEAKMTLSPMPGTGLDHELWPGDDGRSKNHDFTAGPLSLRTTSDQHSLSEQQGQVDESDFSAFSFFSTSTLPFHHQEPSIVPKLLQASPSPFTTSSSSDSPVGSESEETDEAELMRIIQELIEVHEQNTCPDLKFTPEEVLEEQKACHEACKLKEEMFGPMHSISREEYQEIFKSTGLDVDGRQVILNTLIEVIDISIRRYISFAKIIPGFSSLTMNDQIRLIKDNRFENALLSTYHTYNWDLKVATIRRGKTFSMKEMDYLCDGGIGQTRFECANAIRKLGLKQDELIVFKALVTVTAGYEDLDEPQKVSAIQWKMAECLMYLLKQNRPDPNLMFGRIMSTFCNMRCLIRALHDWIKTRPFQLYAQFYKHPLLMEWFSTA